MPRFERVQETPGQVPSATPDAFGSGQGSAAVAGALGQVAQVSEQIADAEAQQRAGLAMARAGAELSARRIEIEQTPDFETYEKRFDEERRKVIEKHRKALGGIRGEYASAFEQRVSSMASREALALRETARAKQIDIAKAQRDESARLRAQMAAATPDDVERQRIINEQLALEMMAFKSGLQDATDFDKRSQDFLKDVRSADARREVRRSPGNAVLRFTDPNDPDFGGMDPEEREIWIDRAITEETLRLRREEAAIRRQEAADKRLKEVQADAASNELAVKAQDTQGPGISVEEVESLKGMLDPSEFRFWLDVAGRDGGYLTPTTSEREAVSRYFDRAAIGDPTVKEDAKGAFLDRSLSHTDYMDTIKVLEDARFKDAHLFLKEALDIGDLIYQKSPAMKFAAQNRAAQAKAEFRLWVREHEEATYDDAMSKAREIVSRTDLSGMSEITAANLPPSSAVFKTEQRDINGKTREVQIIDYEGSRLNIQRRLQAGELTNREAIDEMKRLEEQVRR